MYDSSMSIDPAPRMPGFHDAYCRVTWTPNVGPAPAKVIVGPYLDAESPSDAPTLGCGIEEALHDLGLSDMVDYEHLVPLADAVSRQLATAPQAEIRCQHGTARVELVRCGDRHGST